MKLSEAIRLGATMKPQGFYSYFGKGDKTCALGAAAEASGMGTFISRRDFLHVWPVTKTHVPCPIVTCSFRYSMDETIVHLNDWHQWTREAIADWVELNEPIEASTAPPEELPDPIPTPQEEPVKVA